MFLENIARTAHVYKMPYKRPKTFLKTLKTQKKSNKQRHIHVVLKKIKLNNS